ncbi:hypothetical protein HJC23_008447 [Cyclotella cryptica]|uniref:Putative gamma-glutamylcyclotransferase n=1 Tax=Cyclotella cryptica TaxID=29204 RepID=A0ABD3QWH9_9STRA|eukprot:CCRYP_001171-RA/>CCRYP_001171-RA protein AED:0.01 eAED:0.01 QI:195/-1/1/1/-1/1/1/305/208
MLAPFPSPLTGIPSRVPTTCFVYGTLMSTEVLQTLLGRTPPMVSGVVLHQHVRHPVKGKVYPAVIPSAMAAASRCNDGRYIKDDASGNDTSVQGVLLLNLSMKEIKILDYFEEEGIDYIRTEVDVCVPESAISNVDFALLDRNGPLPPRGGCEQGMRCLETNAYIWARGAEDLDLWKQWDFETFRGVHLKWYLESTVKPCRSEINFKT